MPGQWNILLLEPSRASSKVLTSAFDVFRFQTQVIANIESAIEELRLKSGGYNGEMTSSIHIVVVAHTVQNGAEAVKMIRTAGFSGVVMALTDGDVSGQGDFAESLRRNGADAVLRVPLDMPIFVRAVKTHLALSGLKWELKNPEK